MGKHDPALGFFRTRDSDRLLEEVQESQDSLRDGHGDLLNMPQVPVPGC